jgi:uncharacterized protein
MVDRFVYVAVPLLVAFQVLPHALEERSLLIVLAVGAGLLIPTLFERASRALARRTDALGLVVGLSGLTVHSLMEGAAFAPLSTPVDTTFAWAVILHRVPVGLVMWWLVRPRYGMGSAVAGVGLLVGTTLLGFLIGNEVLDPVHGPGFELYQAFVSGTLVHVVFHQGRHDHAHDRDHEHDHRGHGHLD